MAFALIDMFLPYWHNPLAIQVEEGVEVLSLSQFSGSSEYTLFDTNSYLAIKSEGWLQRGASLRWYQLSNSSEWQALSYYDNKRTLNLGGTWVTTLVMHGKYMQNHAINSIICAQLVT